MPIRRFLGWRSEFFRTIPVSERETAPFAPQKNGPPHSAVGSKVWKEKESIFPGKHTCKNRANSGGLAKSSAISALSVSIGAKKKARRVRRA